MKLARWTGFWLAVVMPVSVLAQQSPMNNLRLPIPLLLSFLPSTASVESVPIIHNETGIHTFLGYLLLVVAVATVSHAVFRHFWRVCGTVALGCALIRVVSYYFSMPVMRYDLSISL